MKLLFALLALSLTSFALSQQNVPTRNYGCEPTSTTADTGGRDGRRLRKADDMLSLAVAALGGDAASLSSNSAAGSVEAKAEFVAERLVHLCQQVTCTTSGGDHGEE